MLSDEHLHVILTGLSTVFGSLGRGLFCLGPDFSIVHASPTLDSLVGEGAAEAARGRPVADVLGEELFGPDGTLRRALVAGETREGRRAEVHLPSLPVREVSLSTAPLRPMDPEVCDPRVAYFVVLRPTEDEEAEIQGRVVELEGLIARSPVMQQLFHLIENLGQSEATVLITGESGTGKELVARAVHRRSHRRRKPFVAVNCAALPPDLLESELFGHVRGAFTGAVRDRVGRFELASEGTLFLDEVAELAPKLQAKLLRVLQERTFERVGESESRETQARIVAATNRDLHRMVLEGDFREDLFYRLRVLPLQIPPLRHRREDVEPLARHLLTEVSERYDRSLRLAPDALALLLRHDWPGNVRELENALEFAVALCRGQTLHAEDLPPEIRDPAAHHPSPAPASPGSLAPRSSTSSGDLDRDTLEAALDRHHWRREDTARELGISRTTLWRRMRELGLSDSPS